MQQAQALSVICQSTFWQLSYEPLRESAAEERWVLSTEFISQEFLSFGAQCLFEPLSASADFTILRSWIKFQNTLALKRTRMKKGVVKSASKSGAHTFSKFNCDKIVLLAGLGVEGDAHQGEKVKHRSRVAKDPTQPNLRQVHLLHAELFDELREKGFDVQPGEIGENITTQGIELLSLPKGSVLMIGETATIEVTGLRNPCTQLDLLKNGLMKAVLDQDENGKLIRKAGVMGIVLEGGEVKIGSQITVALPEKPYIKLQRV